MPVTNYFSLFDLPTSFAISLPQLERTYLKLQKNAHPDKFATAAALQRKISNQQTAVINRAYETLKNPLQRVQHLLELRDENAVEKERTINDGNFLMEQMRWREQVEESEDSPDKLSALGREAATQLGSLYETFESQYADGSTEARELVNLFNKMQYFTRLADEIRNKFDGAA